MVIINFVIIRTLARARSPDKKFLVASDDCLRAQRSGMQTKKVPEGQPLLQHYAQKPEIKSLSLSSLAAELHVKNIKILFCREKKTKSTICFLFQN